MSLINHNNHFEIMISNSCKCLFVAFYRKLLNFIWGLIMFDDKSIPDDNNINEAGKDIEEYQLTLQQRQKLDQQR